MSLAKPLALTIGDPAGIGPEITHKAWQALRATDECFFVIADPMFYPNVAIIDRPGQAASKFKNALPLLPIDCPRITPGQPGIKAAATIIKSIDMAVKFAQTGQAGGIVTNPIAKEVLYRAGFKHPGHTEYLAALTGAALPVMMLGVQNSQATLRVALVTIHMSLQEVPDAVTGDLITRTAKILHAALKRDFGIKNPRIAMTGLNPHAGEGGALGRAEIEILNPAAEKLRAEDIDISDARPADTLFHAEARASYDAVLAMYHDQGLIPVKTLDFHGGVNTTLGLPIIRTSPDHGTAFDIASSGDSARPDSLIAAIKAARIMADCRENYRAQYDG
ncbi:MAG: 4-hydroxythreonine-4-phosphate dehydrogenase PdxA [Robiginitomaculum sp.]|nr:4-hydroxythreonine-4-phosphate dehydrogenase PdxA [Robiginitomaculum sp.]